jgi:SulP family sulfate permease
MQGEPLWLMLGLVALTMAIIQYLPMLTTAIPSSLAAIITVTLIVIGLNFESRTVGDMASIAGGLPDFHIPFSNPDKSIWDLEWIIPQDQTFFDILWIILPYSVIFAAIGLIESLLTLTLIDEITETRGRGNRECVGQGAANVVSGFFGGMGGCAMIGQSMINVNSGGRGRLSGISAALLLLAFILFASGLIEMIPLAALTGVMFMVVIGTFEWSSLRIMGKIPKADAFIIILVSGVTVASDLAIAVVVVVGVIVSALVFAWEHAKHINVTTSEGKMGSKIYELNGPLFFASVQNFQELFDVKNDPDDVVVEFQNSRVMDHSAIEAIDTLAERYLKAGKRLHLRHLTAECQELLEKAGDLVEVNVIEDPKYHVADDRLA